MSFTFVASGSKESGNTTTVALTAPGTVQAGDLIVLWIKHEGATVTMTASDGTTSFTAGTKLTHSNGDLEGQFFYLLASVATGTPTYTITLATARDFKRMDVFIYRPSAACTYDAHVENAATNGTTTITSGNLTTTGTDELVIAGYGEYSGMNLSAQKINATAYDHLQLNTLTETSQTMAWSKTFASTFTGAATATVNSTGNPYLLAAVAFAISGGGGGTTVKTLAATGVGG